MTRITGHSFNNLEELRNLIDHMIDCAGRDASTIYTGPKYANMLEETLTDGSTVYNVVIFDQ